MTIVDANRRAVWAVRRASGPQGLYSRAVVQALEPDDQEPSTPGPKIDTTPPLQGSHLAAAESLLGEVREQSADLDTLIAQLVKRLAHREPDSNVALVVGYHPTPSRSARRRCGCSPRRPRASSGAAHGRVQHPEPSLGLHSLSVALFPMVIMTMTIERMSRLGGTRTGIAAWAREPRGRGARLRPMTAPAMQHVLFVLPVQRRGWRPGHGGPVQEPVSPGQRVLTDQPGISQAPRPTRRSKGT